jgi:hypothetical protein
LRMEMGRKARLEGLRRFSAESVVPIQLQSYERAIARFWASYIDDKVCGPSMYLLLFRV